MEFPHEMLLLGFVLLAGFYMAWNIGANDVANAMGTSVGAGALTLKQAVLIAAILEFSGAFFFGSHVSEMMQKGIVDPYLFADNPYILVYGMLSALLSAGVWLQIASYFGLPVSATHAIVGAVFGFGVIVGGMEAIRWENMAKIVSSWIISPLAGGIFAFYLFSFLRKKIFYTYHPVKETKKLTPFLVFFMLFIFSQILGKDIGKNLGLSYGWFPIFLGGVVLALGGALLSYFFVRRLTSDVIVVKSRPVYGPEIAHSLERARKHLQKIENASVGELNYQMSVLLNEIDTISHSLQKNIEKEVTSSEYRIVEKIFGYLQIMSACFMAFAHGANDVANAIGPLSAAFGALTQKSVSAMQMTIPTWALGLGGFGIVVGLATWGWRVIETIGKKITELTPSRGFVAEFGAATTILIASRLGMPISTTHTLVGAVLGVGLARGIEALNMGMTRDIVLSWIVTIPAGAALAVGFFYGIQWVFG